jgi:hypothetical protein
VRGAAGGRPSERSQATLEKALVQEAGPMDNGIEVQTMDLVITSQTA